MPSHNPGIAGQRDTEGLPLIPTLRWKMRREEIQLAFPDVEDIWIKEGASEKPDYRMLTIRDYEIDGCKFELDLGFFNPPLDTLSQVSGNYVGSNVDDCLHRLQREFQTEFGPHPSKSSGGITTS